MFSLAWEVVGFVLVGGAAFVLGYGIGYIRGYLKAEDDVYEKNKTYKILQQEARKQGGKGGEW